MESGMYFVARHDLAVILAVTLAVALAVAL